jgi:hypothetical protein
MSIPSVRNKDKNTLNTPLLMEEPTAIESKSHQLPENAGRTAPKKLKLADKRVDFYNRPRIVLEVMTGRTAGIFIFTTWIIFIVCFSVDLYSTYRSFHTSNYILEAYDCGYVPIVPNPTNSISCGTGSNWNATVTQLSNIISVGLSVKRTNTTAANITNSIFSIDYNVHLWTCYNENGCGNSFVETETYISNGNVWQQVLSLASETIDVTAADITSNSLSLQLITNTFQNQESLPTNGLAKAYFIEIEYTNDPYQLYTPTSINEQQYVTYTLNIVRSPLNRAAAGINVLLLIVTIGISIGYCYILLAHRKTSERPILSEQKWLIAYFILVILFQNPVYCVIVWFQKAPSATASYSAFFVNYLAQAGLFTLWLLFADSYQRKTQSKLFFYFPKLFIGTLIFVCGIIVLTFQFPSLSVPPSNRSAVEAVENWSYILQMKFVVFTIAFISLIWAWALIWLIRLYRTARAMNGLPYMSTRYMQLSFRFFTLQATLVTIYYIAQYAAVAYFISRDTANGYLTTVTVLADNINVLFRQQFQLIGKTVFLTVYAVVLAIMFLPPDISDPFGIYAAIQATYAVSEEEHKRIVHERKITLKSLNKKLINQLTRLDQITQAKEDVFCVDIGLLAREVSFQAYYDSPYGVQTNSSFGRTQDLPAKGFELIEEFYDPSHEVYCIICRELKTARIFVCFR